MEIWNAARAVREEGVDIRAVTAWSLFGARDWNCLVTSPADHYETGVFDLRSEPPRPTALAGMAEKLAKTGRYQHPLLSGPGWWRRPVRLEPLPTTEQECRTKLGRRTISLDMARKTARFPDPEERPLLLVTSAEGVRGTLGWFCFLRGLPFRSISASEMLLITRHSVREMLAANAPWAVLIALTANSRTSTPEEESATDDTARMMTLAQLIASECARQNIGLVVFSSFGHDEDEEPLTGGSVAVVRPTVRNGSFVSAEKRIVEIHPRTLIVRMAPWPDLSTALPGPEIVNTPLDLLIDSESGVWHIVTEGGTAFARRAGRRHFA